MKKTNEMINEFGKNIVKSLEQNDCHFHTDDFEEGVTVFDDYKTAKEFEEYVKYYYLDFCDQDECDEFGHADLWDEIWKEYKVDFLNIYDDWKTAFEDEKEKFFKEKKENEERYGN